MSNNGAKAAHKAVHKAKAKATNVPNEHAATKAMI